MTDVFISYASTDRPRVKPLVDALQQQGWSVWWDRTILAGKTFDRVIETALKGSRCVIVLWSKDSVESDWVWTEADEGKQRRILVPAILDDVAIPFAFRRIQTANLVGWSGVLPSDQFDELARAVSDVLSNATIQPSNARQEQESEQRAQRAPEESERLGREKQAQDQPEQKRTDKEKHEKAVQERLERENAAQAERNRLEEESRAWAQQERLKRERKRPADQFEFLKRLERDSQTEAELERLEQEQKEPAERERLEREKETQKRAEQERLERERGAQAEPDQLDEDEPAQQAKLEGERRKAEEWARFIETDREEELRVLDEEWEDEKRKREEALTGALLEEWSIHKGSQTPITEQLKARLDEWLSKRPPGFGHRQAKRVEQQDAESRNALDSWLKKKR